jgi:broad specificity phosphatase PhoE
MKIFILRHEDRTQDASFYSPLTKNGLENSIKLIDKIEDLHINHIYSSPYIRTLQTIYPFTKSKGLKIKLEYSLSEINDPHLIPKNAYGAYLPEYLAKSFCYDENYKSSIQPNELKYPENEKDILLRVKNFFKNIITNHYKLDDNILIVTHQVVCNNILNLVNKSIKNKEDVKNYQTGAITLIFENDNWVFKPINWKNK